MSGETRACGHTRLVDGCQTCWQARIDFKRGELQAVRDLMCNHADAETERSARLAAEQERDRLRAALRDTPWNPTNEEPNPAAEVHVEEFRAAVIERAGWRNATPDEWDAARSFLDTATEEKV